MSLRTTVTAARGPSPLAACNKRAVDPGDTVKRLTSWAFGGNEGGGDERGGHSFDCYQTLEPALSTDTAVRLRLEPYLDPQELPG